MFRPYKYENYIIQIQFNIKIYKLNLITKLIQIQYIRNKHLTRLIATIK